MICFEEFDPQTNYPVVLPCGHTYVCVECANRLDRCMECRTPLHMKVEVTPPPPPQPAVQASPGCVAGAAAAAAQSHTGGDRAQQHLAVDHQKENANRYADRIQNSPGYRRKFGNRNDPIPQRNARYQGKNGTIVQPPPPPTETVKRRLPLPKNAVLLSLIQASEPARRRAEVEAPETPQKDAGGSREASPEKPIGAAQSGDGAGGGGAGGAGLPKFSRPSPLFLDNSSSGEQHGGGGYGSDNNNANNGSSGGGGDGHNLVGSLPDDEEHKIRVGTYLEGGPCGTYAVAAKGGLLVYPTLFQHALPDTLNGLRQEDEVDRGVEELVKKHGRKSFVPTIPGDNDSNERKTPKRGSSSSEDNNGAVAIKQTKSEGDARTDDDESKSRVSPVHTEIGISHAWVECHEHGEDGENLGVGFEASTTANELAPSRSPPRGIPMMSMTYTEDEDDNNNVGGINLRRKSPQSIVGDMISDPGGSDHAPTFERLAAFDAAAAMATSAGGGGDDDQIRIGVSASLTLSASDLEEDGDDGEQNADNFDAAGSGDIAVADVATARTLPVRRSNTVSGGNGPAPVLDLDGSSKTTGAISKKFERHFSQGEQAGRKRSGKRTGGEGGEEEEVVVDDFQRPLIRLKYGDRVQVVSMDSRGWVKLARGYGYIRLDNHKDLVKGEWGSAPS